jgi:hypothetical protein
MAPRRGRTAARGFEGNVEARWLCGTKSKAQPHRRRISFFFPPEAPPDRFARLPPRRLPMRREPTCQQPLGELEWRTISPWFAFGDSQPPSRLPKGVNGVTWNPAGTTTLKRTAMKPHRRLEVGIVGPNDLENHVGPRPFRVLVPLTPGILNGTQLQVIRNDDLRGLFFHKPHPTPAHCVGMDNSLSARTSRQDACSGRSSQLAQSRRIA